LRVEVGGEKKVKAIRAEGKGFTAETLRAQRRD